MKEAAIEARDYERKISRERNAQALESLQKTMNVTRLSEAEEAKMRDAVKRVVDKYVKSVGEKVVAEFRSEIDKVRIKK